ncbi:hypothetical protein BY996DRAFT_6411384 [Phakopsora pachyrhizi]|nr:hypothetical protein BY996DRAFT_6411384 [Phakopsora pachyrhizi]
MVFFRNVLFCALLAGTFNLFTSVSSKGSIIKKDVISKRQVFNHPMNLFQSFEGLHAAVDMRLSAINRACETGKMDIVESKLQGILKKFILLVQAVDHPWQLDDGSIVSQAFYVHQAYT